MKNNNQLQSKTQKQEKNDLIEKWNRKHDKKNKVTKTWKKCNAGLAILCARLRLSFIQAHNFQNTIVHSNLF